MVRQLSIWILIIIILSLTSIIAVSKEPIKFDEIYQYEQTKNLFDLNEVVPRKYVNWVTGQLDDNDMYSASGHIPVAATQKYTLSRCNHYAWYNSEKKFISGKRLDSLVHVTITAPPDASYLRISVTLSYKNTSMANYMVVSGSRLPKTYIPFGASIKWLRVGKDNLDFELQSNISDKSKWYRELTLPPNIYAVVGKEMNIYFYNLISDRLNNYYFDVNYDGAAKQQDERVNIIPVNTTRKDLIINLYDTYLNLTKSARTSIVVASTDAKSGQNPKCLFIGDSMTESGVYTEGLLKLFNDDAMKITLIGTNGTGVNRHEGKSGRTVNWFYGDAASPFVFNGRFNFSQYMTKNGFDGVDYVFFQLGTNDVFECSKNSEVDKVAKTNLLKLNSMITSIKAFSSDAKIGIMLAIPPSTHQDAFGNDYGTGQTQWRYKRNIHRYNKTLIDAFKSKEKNGIHLVSTNVNIDTERNMLTEDVPANSRNPMKVIRQSNSVHPAREGYYQISDTIYYFLKNI